MSGPFGDLRERLLRVPESSRELELERWRDRWLDTVEVAQSVDQYVLAAMPALKLPDLREHLKRQVGAQFGVQLVTRPGAISELVLPPFSLDREERRYRLRILRAEPKW